MDSIRNPDKPWERKSQAIRTYLAGQRLAYALHDIASGAYGLGKGCLASSFAGQRYVRQLEAYWTDLMLYGIGSRPVPPLPGKSPIQAAREAIRRASYYLTEWDQAPPLGHTRQAASGCACQPTERPTRLVGSWTPEAKEAARKILYSSEAEYDACEKAPGGRGKHGQ